MPIVELTKNENVVIKADNFGGCQKGEGSYISMYANVALRHGNSARVTILIGHSESIDLNNLY